MASIRVQGFTLIELLISISLLSVVMLLGTTSIGLFIDRWDGRLGHFSKKISNAKDMILLNDIVTTIVPFVFQSPEGVHYYFNGTKNKLSGVAQKGIFYSDRSVAFELQIRPEQHNEGSYLIYREGELPGRFVESSLAYTYEKVLISSASQLSFSYIGWRSLQEKMSAEDPTMSSEVKSPEPLESYDSQQSSLMPDAIVVNINDSNLSIPLANDHGHWKTMLSSSEY